MSFMLGKNLVFIYSMQFMNYSIEDLVKKNFEDKFKYLSEEFCGKQLEFIKQKGIYP